MRIVIAAALVAVGSMLVFAESKEWIMDRIDDDIIRELVAGGEVCRVIGHHNWEPIQHLTLEYRPDGYYPEHRKCTLCGKVETKQPGEWK